MKKSFKKSAALVLAMTGVLSVCQPFEALGKKVYIPADETVQEEETVEEVTDETAPPTREIDGEVYYELDSAEDLFWFAERVNSAESIEEKYVNAVLTDDIVINEEAYDGTNGDSLTVWTQIGGYRGCFDGQNHTISGLYINESYYNSGFFRSVYDGGIVKNVGIIDSYIKGGENVGAICGQLDKASISGCYNKGTVKGGTYFVGGICGESQGGTITNCYNAGDVSGFEYAAGICGNNEHGGTISYCYNTGEITSSRYSGYYTGGICAYNNAYWGDTLISHCYNTGNLNGWPSTVAGICAKHYKVVGVYGRAYELYYENCYYLDTTADIGTLGYDREGVESKTAEEFENGEVAKLLNEGSKDGDIYVQNIGTDSSPVLAVFQN